MSAADFRDSEERAMQADAARWRELLLSDMNANSIKPEPESEPEPPSSPGPARIEYSTATERMDGKSESTKTRKSGRSKSKSKDEDDDGVELSAPRALSQMDRWPPELLDEWLAATDPRTGATPLHVAAAKGYIGILRCAAQNIALTHSLTKCEVLWLKASG